jgi:hypothetical protein
MIQSEIENAISSRFLTGEFKENGVITVKSKNKALIFEQQLKKVPKVSKSTKRRKVSSKTTQIT